MGKIPQQSVERRAAAKALVVTSGHASDGMSRLSVWITVGVGAAFALVITNLDVVSRFVEVNDVRVSLLIFLASIILGGLARLLGVMVQSSVGTSGEGQQMGQEMAKDETDYDMSKFGEEFKKGCLPPYSWIVQWSIDKAMAGDAAASARFTSKTSQIQALLVLVQMLTAGAALIYFGVSIGAAA